MADHRRSTLFLLTFLLSLSIEPGESQICPAVYFSATYDLPCIDSCETHGYSYYYCHTKDGWDYCSPGVDIDYQGNECLGGSPCTKFQYTHMCVTRVGIPQMCGRVEPMAMHHKTIYLKECISQCQYYESGDYFWCYTADSWYYCSPRPDITYMNVPCRSDHQCGTYGYDYGWCYTTYNNNWDYCGPSTPGECSYTGSSRRKRQPGASKSNVICTREDQNTHVVTEFIESPGSVAMANINRRLQAEAQDLINRFDGQGLSEQSRSELVTSPNFRIDNQGMVNLDNQRYYNLQVQINGPRGGRATTVSNILAPADVPADYMRLGLSESLVRGIKVVLEVKDESGPSTSGFGGSKKGCNRRKH